MTVQERKAMPQRGRRKASGGEQGAKAAHAAPGHGEEAPKTATYKTSTGSDPAVSASPEKDCAAPRRRARGGGRRNKRSNVADVASTVVEADAEESTGYTGTPGHGSKPKIGASAQPIQRADAEKTDQSCVGTAARDGSSSSEEESAEALLAFPPGLPPGLSPVVPPGLPKTVPPSLPPTLPPGLDTTNGAGFDFEFSRQDETEEVASASECAGLVLAKGHGRENSATCSTTASGASSPRTVTQAAIRTSLASAAKPCTEEAATSKDKVGFSAAATATPVPSAGPPAVMRLIARVQHAWQCEEGCASSQLSASVGEFLYTWPSSRTSYGWIYAERPISGGCGEKFGTSSPRAAAGWLPIAALQNLGPHRCWARVARTTPAVHQTCLSVAEGDAVLVDTRSLQGALQSGVAFVERPSEDLRCGGVGWVPYACLDWF